MLTGGKSRGRGTQVLTAMFEIRSWEAGTGVLIGPQPWASPQRPKGKGPVQGPDPQLL